MSSYLLDRALPARAADLLRFAAAPIFAILTLANAVGQSDGMAALCAGDARIGNMTLMYLLMAIFHAAPWLKLCAGRPLRHLDPPIIE